MARQTKRLNSAQLTTFINSVMTYEDKVRHTQLLWSLTIAAAHLDQRLHSVLTVALAKSKENPTFYGRLLRVLQIAQLSEDSLHQLVSELLHIANQKEKAYMLGLLGSRMQYLHLADRGDVLNNVLSLIDESEKIAVLRGIALSILYLAEKDAHRLLGAIAVISGLYQSELYQRADVLSILVGAVYKKLAGLP